MKKEMYQPPRIEVIEMESEGIAVIPGSYGNGGGIDTRSYSSSGTTRSSKYATSSEIEDMIEDLFTIQQ